MAVALLSVVGLFISAYLYLYKIGAIGTLACGTGECETVQLSPQSRFLGVEVALIGILGYVALLGTSMAAIDRRFAGRTWPLGLLLILSAGAFGFTLYLKYLEFFVIHAICRWCVASAVIITAIFALTVIEYRRSSAPGR